MAVNDALWSYGKLRRIKSSGATVADGDAEWNYGKKELIHELEAEVGWTGIINTITNPAKVNGIAVANIKSVSGVE